MSTRLSSWGVVAASLTVLSAFTVVTDPSGTDAPLKFADESITFVLQENGSADVDDGSDLVAMRRALESFSSVACSGLSLVDGGTSSSGNRSNDGINRIAFREDTWPGGANGAAAVTTRSRNTGASPQVFVDADILLNGVDFVWSTAGHTEAYDVQAIVTHELGHALGLQHSASTHSSMYFGGRRGQTHQRTLSPDDEAGLCFLYPASSASCTIDADCPLFDPFYGGGRRRTRCEDGSCVNGAAGYGADCLAPDDCASGLCAGDPANNNGDDPGFCTTTCTPGGGDCPDGDFCTAQNGGLCIAGRDDCMYDADCGSSNDVCPLDLDGRYRCTHLCLLDSHCESGELCHGGTGENPPGFCRLPGDGALGAGCDHGYDCASLTCAGEDTACSERPLGSPAEPGDGDGDGDGPGEPTDGGSAPPPTGGADAGLADAGSALDGGSGDGDEDAGAFVAGPSGPSSISGGDPQGPFGCSEAPSQRSRGAPLALWLGGLGGAILRRRERGRRERGRRVDCTAGEAWLRERLP